MKAREFVRKHVEPAGGVLQRTDGDHHIYRLPNGRTFVVPMGGKHSEAAHWLIPKLRRVLQVASVVALLLLHAGCGGDAFTLSPGAVVDPAAGDSGEDAAPSPEASREADDGPQHDAIDHDAGPWPEEAGTNTDAVGDHVSGSSGGEAGSTSSSSGSSSGSSSSSSSSSSSGSGSSSGSSGSSSSSGGAVDAGPCEGGTVYTHHVGAAGLTWQDCTPTGTISAKTALAACDAYQVYDLATNGCTGTCSTGTQCAGSAGGASDVVYVNGACGGEIVWDFANSVAPGHVNTHATCPVTTDPVWN